jgi:hypothetical protein
LVATRWVVESTNSSALGTIPATGRRVRVDGLILDRVVGGKVIDTCTLVNITGLQLRGRGSESGSQLIESGSAIREVAGVVGHANVQTAISSRRRTPRSTVLLSCTSKTTTATSPAATMVFRCGVNRQSPGLRIAAEEVCVAEFL